MEHHPKSRAPSDLDEGWHVSDEVIKRLGRSRGKMSPLVTQNTHVWTDDGKTVCRYRLATDDDSEITESEFTQTVMNSYAQPHENNTRQRLRPWLEARINSGEVSGLAWTNKDQKMFKVPWKHVGNREWCESDGKVFKEWAVHTGRFREGVDAPDWPTWKTRFRCALTKLPDIKEMKEYNQLDGQTEEPYRVYRFMPRNNDNIENMPHSNSTCSPLGTGYSNSNDEIDGFFNNEPTIPTTVASDETGMDQRWASDLNSIPSGDLIQVNSTDMRQVEEAMDTTDGRGTSLDNIAEIAKKEYPGQNIAPAPAAPIRLTIDTNDPKLYITVKYRHTVVHEGLSASMSGCRIFYDMKIPMDQTEPGVYDQMFGSRDATEIKLPDCITSNMQQEKLTAQLLRVTDRGLIIKVEQGNIVATRKCRCSIFVSSKSLNNGETTKLKREEPTVIFNLQEYFAPALERYLYQKEEKPSSEVLLSFGQRFDQNKESLSNLLISATVVHTEASNLLTRIACTSPTDPSIEISKSDNYDRFLDTLHYHRTNGTNGI